MRILRILAFVLAALSIGQPAFAQGISNLPRQDTIIIENPQGTDYQPDLVQHLGSCARGRLDRPTAARHGHALVH